MALSLLDLSLTTLRALSGNWVRSGLTALGIFMGVAAVNATLNIEAISQQVLADQLAQRENPALNPYVYSRDKPDVDYTDALIAELEQAIPEILSVSRVTWLYGFNVQYLDKQPDLNLFSVSPNYQRTTGRQLIEGRFFDSTDFEAYRPVVIIDETLSQQLFEGKSPLGEGIFIGNTRFTVIGVSESKRDMWDSEEPTGVAWLTETYGTVMQGQYYGFTQIQVALRKLEDYEKAEESVEAQLKQMFPGYEVDLWGNVEDLYKEDQRQKASIRVLKAVGILALVIGGVGIANITIAAIMERTREIGLRRAIGATDVEIMAQFIAEAALLSLLGGTAAVVAVHFATKAATTTIFEAPYTFSPQNAALSMGAAFMIGVGSSLLPALRITRIDVVQALRGE